MWLAFLRWHFSDLCESTLTHLWKFYKSNLDMWTEFLVLYDSIIRNKYF